MEEKRKIELLLEHLNSEISNDYNDINNCDVQCYQETTADGYDVYIVTDSPSWTVIVSENVYYYNHNLAEIITEYLMNQHTTVFIDEHLMEDIYLEDELLAKFEDFVDEIMENDDLNINEIKELQDEYGIEEEEIT